MQSSRACRRVCDIRSSPSAQVDQLRAFYLYLTPSRHIACRLVLHRQRCGTHLPDPPKDLLLHSLRIVVAARPSPEAYVGRTEDHSPSLRMTCIHCKTNGGIGWLSVPGFLPSHYA